MLTNTLWLVLYVGLVAGIGGAGYYLGYERGHDDGAESAELTEDQALYFDTGIETIAQLGYTWTGETWATPVPGSGIDARPTASPLPDRTSCSEIDGTPYRSSSERLYFLTNCVSVSVTPEPSQAPCGEPVNPWCYDLFPGDLITNPPSNFCEYFECVDGFWSGAGYVIKCQDGMFSKTGGSREPCSDHGGVSQPLYSH